MPLLATVIPCRYHARMDIRLLSVPLLICVIAFAATGCVPHPVHPVPALSYPLGEECDTLLVFLPGRGDRDWSFEKHGLIRDARAAGLRADILVPDLHIGYYREATTIGTLHDDVIRPALEKGYRSIWLVGVSAGGLAAILHEQFDPGMVAGIILVAPYLGEPGQLSALARAGGLSTYRPGTLGEPEYISHTWLWLQSRARKTERVPPVFAGFGTDDAYAPPREVLERVFGPERVLYLEGAHDWPTFRKLFRELLGRALAGPLAWTGKGAPPAPQHRAGQPLSSRPPYPACGS